MTLTSGGVQAAVTLVALVMLRLLMGDENLQVIEVALAVVTPRPSQNLFDIWMVSFLLRHGGPFDSRVTVVYIAVLLPWIACLRNV